MPHGVHDFVNRVSYEALGRARVDVLSAEVFCEPLRGKLPNYAGCDPAVVIELTQEQIVLRCAGEPAVDPNVVGQFAAKVVLQEPPGEAAEEIVGERGEALFRRMLAECLADRVGSAAE